LLDFVSHLTVLAVIDGLLIAFVIPWVLMTKKDTTAAVAWCLLVFFLPLLGSLLFWVFGYNQVWRPIRRKQRHRSRFEAGHPPLTREASRGEPHSTLAEGTWNDLGTVALKVNAFAVSGGNAVTLYDETEAAFTALLQAIRGARHHIHLEFFIVRDDATGKLLVDLLAEKAKAGVEVRLLADSVGSRRLGWRWKALRPLREAGGKVSAFLPLNPVRSRLRVNMRNHRKITVIDGAVGFTGGMNIGDEYLGKVARFGYWRDQFLRLEGPGVAGLQRVFVEDWDFAANEPLDTEVYYPEVPDAGESIVQIIESGPDQDRNSIRELLFAAVSAAQERVWMATPYFVPDGGLLDALRLACYRGVDVRLLCPLRSDKALTDYAARYLWSDLLAVGMNIYQYAKGMLHGKMIAVDGRWGMVGSANLDNRSLHLNFEAGCILHSPPLIAELEASFLHDLETAVRVDGPAFSKRPFLARLKENACRLFSPIL
jgi:cardiolipin synthase